MKLVSSPQMEYLRVESYRYCIDVNIHDQLSDIIKAVDEREMAINQGCEV